MARVGIVLSEFNYDITYMMLQKALEHAKFLGLQVSFVIRVPGVLETPLAVHELLLRGDIDGVIVLGAVLKGETKHDEVVAHQAIRKLLDLSVEYGKPIGVGVIGPGASRSQALERVEEYSRRAVEAVAKMIKRISGFKNSEFRGETVFID